MGTVSINKAPVRFDLLDGLRGIAAIAVMTYHYTENNGLHWLEGAWVAVDLFFILSGFVIAHSYGSKILDGMKFWQFARARLVRLGPLYWLGLTIGLIAALLPGSYVRTAHMTTAEIFSAFGSGIVFLPYFSHLSSPLGWPVFPLNVSAWSLFFELFVNVVFFVFVFYGRTLATFKFALLWIGIYFLCIVGFRPINPGWSTAGFAFGFPRVIAEFFAGVLIYTLRGRMKRPSRLLTVFAATVSILGFTVSSLKLAFLNSITFMPLTILLMASFSVEGVAKAACKYFGRLSYPLYIIHMPFYWLIVELFDVKSLPPIGQTLCLGMSCIGAASALAILDQRIGGILNAALNRPKISVA